MWEPFRASIFELDVREPGDFFIRNEPALLFVDVFFDFDIFSKSYMSQLAAVTSSLPKTRSHKLSPRIIYESLDAVAKRNSKRSAAQLALRNRFTPKRGKDRVEEKQAAQYPTLLLGLLTKGH